jgi:L-threonylcarbamoyladenylate synthase
VQELLDAGQRVGWLTFETVIPDAPGLVVHEMPLDVPAYAAVLYAILHALDGAGLDRIIVDEPPPSEEWTAIHDRLRRASASPG